MPFTEQELKILRCADRAIESTDISLTPREELEGEKRRLARQWREEDEARRIHGDAWEGK